MKGSDLKEGERYYLARLDNDVIAFSFVLAQKSVYFYGLSGYYRIHYKSPFYPNFMCELEVAFDNLSKQRDFNESNPSVLKVNDSLFISNDKESLAREIMRYYRARTPNNQSKKSKYYKVINELKKC